MISRRVRKKEILFLSKPVNCPSVTLYNGALKVAFGTTIFGIIPKEFSKTCFSSE
jgi:hypothetical protein